MDNGGWLYPLMILFPLNALALVHATTSRSLRSAFMAAVVMIVSLPLGWFLFRNGMSAPVNKYGLTFTGADFLLGPDRKQKLPEAMLMFRYSIIQIGAILVMAYGMRLILKATRSPAPSANPAPARPAPGQQPPAPGAPPPSPLQQARKPDAPRSFLR